jgi:predicted nucleotidyltransferase
VKIVNRDPHYLYRVDRVIVFGSYITSASRLSDIDLALAYSAKEPDPDRRAELDQRRSDEAAEGGRRFDTMIDFIAWPHIEVQLFLRSRSRYLSLHPESEGVLAHAAQRVLYPA